jgi:hypothetical protein
MSQIPISTKTYSKLNVLKTKAIIHNKGISITWDAIVDSLIENANLNENQFLTITTNQNGKSRKKFN